MVINNNELKIAFVSEWGEINDPARRSGLPYFMIKNIRKHGVQVIPIVVNTSHRGWFNKVISRFKKIVYNKVLQGKLGFYNPARSKEFLEAYSKVAKKKLERLNYDVILCPGTLPVAYLEEIEKPLVVWVDATFSSLCNYYPEYSNFHNTSIEDGNKAEALAFRKASLLLFSSEWAAKSAINDYECSKEKVKVVPFGSNFDSENNFSEIEEIIRNRDKNICKLLFVGANWERKGGEIVYQVCQKLRQLNFKFELHIVGVPKTYFKNGGEWLFNHGYLDKSNDIELKNILDLFEKSHFLFMPTRYEAFGHVYAEASSFGLPSLATNTGGVSSVVRDEVNGKLFTYNATIDEYARYIITTFQDEEAYYKLCINSFSEYKKRLNWDSNVKLFLEYLNTLVQRKF
jgi:glycosyltransferase involved in cell wall biosynthesis